MLEIENGGDRKLNTKDAHRNEAFKPESHSLETIPMPQEHSIYEEEATSNCETVWSAEKNERQHLWFVRVNFILSRLYPIFKYF